MREGRLGRSWARLAAAAAAAAAVSSAATSATTAAAAAAGGGGGGVVPAGAARSVPVARGNGGTASGGKATAAATTRDDGAGAGAHAKSHFGNSIGTAGSDVNSTTISSSGGDANGQGERKARQRSAATGRRSDNASNPFYFSHWCGLKGALPSLDDAKCVKRFPPAPADRGWRCPSVWPDAQARAPGFRRPDALWAPFVNESALADAGIDPRATVALIEIRRTQSGEVWVRRLGRNASTPHETWSSSKIFAAANAAGPLRASCGRGLDGSTIGRHGETPLGDLATVICSYDTTAGYTSNSLARYFLDLGGRPRVRRLVREWLGAGNDSLGGNYGEPVPSDMRYGETVPDGSGSKWCPEGPNRTDDGDYTNSLSAAAAAEFLRRLVLHRESAPPLRVPGVVWADVEATLYGAESTSLFPRDELLWGGMSADTAVYLQRSLRPERFDDAAGRWRVFSKLGAGFSTSRGVGEVISVAYGCFPRVDGAGEPALGGGLELVVAGRASVPGDTGLGAADAVLLDTVRRAVAAVDL